jgi:hypothetical protein
MQKRENEARFERAFFAAAFAARFSDDSPNRDKKAATVAVI